MSGAQMMMQAARRPAASLAFLQATGSASDLSVYTFSSRNLGSAAAGRYIIVATATRSATGAAGRAASVTVAGVAATKIVEVDDGGDTGTGAAIFVASVPTGTTGDIVVTYGAQQLRAGISVYRATGINSAAVDTATSTANPLSLDTDVPANGFIVGVAAANAASATFSWVGLAEDSDLIIEAPVTLSTASALFSDHGTKTITATPSNPPTTPSVSCAASWGPA